MVKLIWFKTYLNLWRTFIAYVLLRKSRFRDKFIMDLSIWKKKNLAIKSKSDFIAFSFLCFDCLEFRNVFLNRLHRNYFSYIIVSFLFKRLESLYINMPPEDIGGGLYFQHGFSTIVTAKKIGNNCHINQQVTIGYNGDDAPVIGDNCTICAGAIIIGDVNIEDNCIIGAGSVVVKNVKKDSIVAGVPAKKIK